MNRGVPAEILLRSRSVSECLEKPTSGENSGNSEDFSDEIRREALATTEGYEVEAAGKQVYFQEWLTR